MNPATKKKLLILGGVGGLTAVGLFLSETFLKPKEEGEYDVSSIGVPFTDNSPVLYPETPALPGQNETPDWQAFIDSITGGLPTGSMSGGPSGFGSFVPTSGGYGDVTNPVDPSGKDTITPSGLVTKDIGVVKYATYPGEPMDVNTLDPISRVVYESGRGTGFLLRNAVDLVTAPFKWLSSFRAPSIPGVEAQIVTSPKTTYPDPSPSVSTPEGWISNPTGSSLGYMPSVLTGSQTTVNTGKMPYTPVREQLTPIKTVQTNPFAKPSWLG